MKIESANKLFLIAIEETKKRVMVFPDDHLWTEDFHQKTSFLFSNSSTCGDDTLISPEQFPSLFLKYWRGQVTLSEDTTQDSCWTKMSDLCQNGHIAFSPKNHPKGLLKTCPNSIFTSILNNNIITATSLNCDSKTKVGVKCWKLMPTGEFPNIPPFFHPNRLGVP